MSFSEWKTYKVEELCRRIISGGTPSTTKKEYYGGDIPWLKTQEVNFNRIYDTDTKITKEGFENSSAKMIEPNSIIVAMYGATAAKLAINKIPLSTNQACCNLTVDEKKADYHFLYYYLRNEYSNLVNLTNGGAQQNLSSGVIKNFEIKAPDLKTQQRIASILSSLDDAIELNQQINKTLEEMAKAIFKEWFIDFNFPNATGKFQETEIGKIPVGWKVATFEDVFDADRGLSYKGAGLAESDATPMHNLNSVLEGGGYKTIGIKYYNGDYKDKHIVNAGEVIVANTEQGHKHLLIGYPAIVPQFYGEHGIFSHHIYRLRPMPNCYLSPDFIYHLLLQTQVREQVIGFANGTTVNMLKIEGLQKPKFAMPPKELAEKFGAIAKANRLQAEQNIEENLSLMNLRDTLLPKLMKGEISINL